MKRFKKYLLMLCGCMIGTAGFAETKADTKNTSSDAGHILFKAHCISCHGTSGKGDGPAAVALKKVPPDLTKISARRDGDFPYVEIASFIDGRKHIASHGSRTMPIWGKRFGELMIQTPLKKEQLISGNLLALVLYLESIQK